MDETTRAPYGITESRTKRSERIVGGAGAIEFAGGAGTMALAIIALAGGAPLTLFAICCIAAGGTLIFASSSMGAEVKRHAEREGKKVAGGGLGVEMIGGIAGVCFGVLAVIGLAPLVLSTIALIALGGALVLGSAVAARAEAVGIEEVRARRVNEGGAALEAIAGLGAVALGILSLIGVSPLFLGLVGMLCVGGGLLLAGLAIMSGVAIEHRVHV